MKLTKIYFSVILFFTISNIFAGSTDTVFVSQDTIKLHQINITTPWLYHPGDNFSWSKREYDDSEWDTLNSEFYIDEVPSTKWTGMGWFRKTVVIDSLLINKSVALSMNHFGASQVFWNGELLHNFGTVGADTASEVNVQPNSIPIVINLDSTIINTLAIRYSNQNSVTNKSWMTRWFRMGGFRISISDINDSFNKLIIEGRIASALNFGITGLFLSLSALYFFLFIFYARRVENLYYSLFNFFIGLLFASIYFEHAFFINLSVSMFIKSLSALSVIYAFLFFLAFLNSIFYSKMTKIFWVFSLASFVFSIILFVYSSREVIAYFIPYFIVFATIEGLRIIIVAIVNKKSNAWIIGGGVISFATLTLVIFALAILGGEGIRITGIFAVLFFILGFLSIPISMSIYLARDIAITNKNLENQLETVKKLSIKELEHQKRTAELLLEAERERVENERKSKELEEARNLQISLLPTEIPKFKDYEIAVHMDTATEVGGDYYDFHTSDNILTVAIGDATGHGLNAGTMVTATKSLFNYFANEPDILKSMEKISSALRKMNFRLLSMCFALLKIENNSIKFTSAGMPPVYVYKNDKKIVEEIMLKGMPLGKVVNFPYKYSETELQSGDVLLLFSDGFPELFNSKKELLGYDRVKNEFLKSAGKEPTEIINDFKTIINNWKGNLEINDDITFVVIKKQ